MHEQRPTFRANEERDRDRPDMGREKWRALAIEHWVKYAAPVKLICAFAESQHGRIGVEFYTSVCPVFEDEFLDQLAIGALNGKREGLRRHHHVKLSDMNFLF